MANNASGLPDPRLTGEDTSSDFHGAVNRRTPLGRNDHAVTSLPNGVVIEDLGRRSRTGGGSQCAAFYKQFVREGSRYLVTGQVSAGSGSQEVEVKLSDVGSEPADNQLVWLEISGTGVTEDGLLFPGFNLTSVSTGSGSSLPDNDLPTANDDSGKAIVLLGSWLDKKFTAASCGNIQVSFCPGSFSITRF